jgi:hypothetical protein
MRTFVFVVYVMMDLSASVNFSLLQAKVCYLALKITLLFLPLPFWLPFDVL